MEFVICAFIVTLVIRGLFIKAEGARAVVTTGDAVGHLGYVKEYYRRSGGPTNMAEYYLLDGNDYPNGFHKMFYLLNVPIGWLEKYGCYVPVFMDLVFLVIIAMAIFHTGGTYYQWILAFPLLRCLWGNEGRASHFNERAFGVLLGSTYILSSVLIFNGGNSVWIMSAVLGLTVAGISSKFASQAMCFFSIGLSLLCWHFFFICFYMTAMLLGIFLTRGYLWVVLRGQIRHSRFYRDSVLKGMSGLPTHYSELFHNVFTRRWAIIVFRSSPLRFITDNPLTICFIYISFYHARFDVFGAWAALGIILTLLISTSPLKHLGEPERYLEFSICPIFIFLSNYSPIAYRGSATAAALVALLVLLGHLHLMSRNSINVEKTTDLIELGDEISKYKNKTILAIPLRVSFYLGYRTIENQYVNVYSNVPPGERGKDYLSLRSIASNLCDGAGFVKLKEKFKVDLIILGKDEKEYVSRRDMVMSLTFASEILYENKSYCVFKVDA